MSSVARRNLSKLLVLPNQEQEVNLHENAITLMAKVKWLLIAPALIGRDERSKSSTCLRFAAAKRISQRIPENPNDFVAMLRQRTNHGLWMPWVTSFQC